jgi:hypothetical protein
MVIEIPNYRAVSRNKTNKKHWSYYFKEKEAIRQFIMIYNKEEIRPYSNAKMTIKAYFKGKRHIDVFNIDDKIYSDILMEMGFFKDDNAYYIPVVEKYVYPESGEDKLQLLISEIE